MSFKQRSGWGQLGQSPLSYQALRVGASSQGRALAPYLAEHLLMTETEAADLIDFGSVQIDARQERDPARRLEGAEEIRIYWPRKGIRRFYELDPERILYRDGHLLAYNKEPGIPSQQTPSDGYNNLFAALQRYLKRDQPPDSYAALHHRLDMETSGVMLFALERSANRALGSAFEHHQAVKDYLAWVSGLPAQESWVSREDITRRGGRYQTCPQGEGKSAETAFRVLHQERDRTLLWARPRTGRTHQIRLHLAACGHPVLGDPLYGTSKTGMRLHLHAYRLSLPHPATGAPLTVTAPVPQDWPPPHAPAIPE